MAGKTSGDSIPGVSAIIFRGIQDSFTTQADCQNPPESTPKTSLKSSLARERPGPPTGLKPDSIPRVKSVWRSNQCPMRYFVTKPS
jgi:hypothetical protein